jgi:hypothetical protein
MALDGTTLKFSQVQQYSSANVGRPAVARRTNRGASCCRWRPDGEPPITRNVGLNGQAVVAKPEDPFGLIVAEELAAARQLLGNSRVSCCTGPTRGRWCGGGP